MNGRLLATLALLIFTASRCFPAEPFARATIDDKGSIVPGQQVHVVVTVFAPDFFTAPPQFPLFDIPDAVVTLPDERAMNSVQTIDRVQYSGISRTYAVVPQAPGTFTLPPATIELGYSDQGKPIKGKAQLPPVSFTVGEAVGGITSGPIFAARGLVLEQSFDRDPAKLTVGDAIVRTITVFATDTQAMMIPAVDILSPDGMKTYSKPPKIADGVSVKGVTGATRIETITYIAGGVGTYEIPAVSYSWYDVDAHQTRQATLAATRATVAEALPHAEGFAPELQQEEPGSVWISARALVLPAIGLAAIIVAVAAIWYLAPRIASIARKLARSKRSAERAQFNQLMWEISHESPQEIYTTLLAWTRSMGFRSIPDWLTSNHDAALTSQQQKLEKELFGGDTNNPAFDRVAFAYALQRSRYVHPLKQDAGYHSALPALNPD